MIQLIIRPGNRQNVHNTPGISCFDRCLKETYVFTSGLRTVICCQPLTISNKGKPMKVPPVRSGSPDLPAGSKLAVNRSSTGRADETSDEDRQGGSGALNIPDLESTKGTDASSPELTQAAVNGKSIPEVDLNFYRPGSDDDEDSGGSYSVISSIDRRA